MDDWKEKLLQLYNKHDLEIGTIEVENDIRDFISSLLSSQEQKHKKEMEELIESIPLVPTITPYQLKEDLKSKYLTKGKE